MTENNNNDNNLENSTENPTEKDNNGNTANTENQNYNNTENFSSNQNNPYQTEQQNNASQQPPFLYSWDGAKQAPVKKKKGLKIFAATVTVCLFLTLALIGWSISMGYIPNGNSEVSTLSGDTSEKDSTVSIPEVIKTSDSKVENKSDLSELYNLIDDSCVSVVTDVALGSGFIVTADGYIITNHHVIEGAKSIKVVFYDGKEYKATLVGSNETSDIAVLDIEGTDFTPIAIGNSDNVQVGEDVVAVGTPYSIDLAGTITTGIISGIKRDIKITNDYGTPIKTMTLIQTDTTINPGNSGGPLINMAGQVIGINTMKLMEEFEGLGFAIPINSAIKIANAIIAGENVESDFVTASAKLNVTVITVSDAVSSGELVTDYKLPDGAFVYTVARGSSIYKAGLEQYDIITEFNGTAITSKEDLIKELGKHQAGETVSIKVFRLNRQGTDGENLEFSFVLDSAS